MLNIIDLDSGSVQSINASSQLMNRIVNGQMREIFNEANYEELQDLEAGYGNMADDLENVVRGLTNQRGIQFLFKKNGKLEGYLSSMPADEFHAERRTALFDASPDILYVESVIGKTSLGAIGMLLEQAKEKGYKKISIIGINNRLNEVLKKRYQFALVEEVLWLGQEAEYMEVEL